MIALLKVICDIGVFIAFIFPLAYYFYSNRRIYRGQKNNPSIKSDMLIMLVSVAIGMFLLFIENNLH